MRRRLLKALTMVLATTALITGLYVQPAQAVVLVTLHQWYPRQTATQTVTLAATLSICTGTNRVDIRLSAAVDHATASSVHVQWVQVRMRPYSHAVIGGPFDAYGENNIFSTNDGSRLYPIGVVTQARWTVNRTARLNGSGDALVLDRRFFHQFFATSACTGQFRAVFHFV